MFFFLLWELIFWPIIWRQEKMRKVEQCEFSNSLYVMGWAASLMLQLFVKTWKWGSKTTCARRGSSTSAAVSCSRLPNFSFLPQKTFSNNFPASTSFCSTTILANVNANVWELRVGVHLQWCQIQVFLGFCVYAFAAFLLLLLLHFGSISKRFRELWG